MYDPLRNYNEWMNDKHNEILRQLCSSRPNSITITCAIGDGLQTTVYIPQWQFTCGCLADWCTLVEPYSRRSHCLWGRLSWEDGGRTDWPHWLMPGQRPDGWTNSSSDWWPHWFVRSLSCSVEYRSPNDDRWASPWWRQGRSHSVCSQQQAEQRPHRGPLSAAPIWTAYGDAVPVRPVVEPAIPHGIQPRPLVPVPGAMVTRSGGSGQSWRLGWLPEVGGL